jgi:hypothetical protein
MERENDKYDEWMKTSERSFHWLPGGDKCCQLDEAATLSLHLVHA